MEEDNKIDIENTIGQSIYLSSDSESSKIFDKEYDYEDESIHDSIDGVSCK